jgi:acetoacetyl-CoA synthetase
MTLPFEVPTGVQTAIPSGVQTGTVLWTPSPEQIAPTRLAAYLQWLEVNQGLKFEALWTWSVDELEAFWQSVWDHFDVQADGTCDPVLGSAEMPGANWFPNTRLNYAEHVFRKATPNRPALVARSEGENVHYVSWAELERSTGALALKLRAMGVVSGDRVASYMPNRPETVIAFLACASLGAIWSSCAPDMGATVVLDRFRQIEPKVLFAVDSYSYNGKAYDRTAMVEELVRELPGLQKIVHVPGPTWSASELSSEVASAATSTSTPPTWRSCLSWAELTKKDAPLQYERVAFSHPLWIVYSSGTTGLPKAIVHSHGGIVLTHLKTLALQHDLRPGDCMLFLGSTGWIVWNLQVGALLTGASIVLYDGNPAWPNAEALWRFIDEQDVTLLGCGAAFLSNCMKDGLRPRDFAALRALRSINSTGSPLPNEAYAWVYDAIKPDLWLASISGGTDIASGFVACAPTLPVTAGQIQCRELGVAAYAFDEVGNSIVNEVGELVVTKPMPSMPVFFWNDTDGQRYRESYFEQYPGIWRHGDWIRFTPQGTSVIYGRSDTTINRYGIRMGTAEIYRVVEELPEVRDSLVVDLEYLGRPSYMPLFVVLNPGFALDEPLKARIVQQIKTKASARHVPNEIFIVSEIPRTLTGKKMELPVRKLLLGIDASKVANLDAMVNPSSFDFFVHMAQKLNSPRGGHPLTP